MDFREIVGIFVGRLWSREELIKFWKWYRGHCKFTSLSTTHRDLQCQNISNTPLLSVS